MPPQFSSGLLRIENLAAGLWRGDSPWWCLGFLKRRCVCMCVWSWRLQSVCSRCLVACAHARHRREERRLSLSLSPAVVRNSASTISSWYHFLRQSLLAWCKYFYFQGGPAGVYESCFPCLPASYRREERDQLQRY